MGHRVILSAQADRDLEQIVRFLARKNQAAAERLGYTSGSQFVRGYLCGGVVGGES